MSTQGNTTISNTENKLDQVWNQVSREKAVDFIKRSVNAKTTLSELVTILSYQRVAELKDQLANVSLGEVVQGQATSNVKHSQPGSSAIQAGSKEIRVRTTKADIEREAQEVLMALRDNPGIGRDELTKKVRAKLVNKSLSHVSYLLRTLAEQGKIAREGERKNATYTAAQ